MNGQPALFDLADFEREAVAATPWRGAPLTYTTDYYDPSDLLVVLYDPAAGYWDSSAYSLAAFPFPLNLDD